MHEFLYQNPAFDHSGVSLPTKAKRKPSPSAFRDRAKIAMIRKKETVTSIAKALGVSRICASQAINQGLHEPTRRRIAKLLKIAA